MWGAQMVGRHRSSVGYVWNHSDCILRALIVVIQILTIFGFFEQKLSNCNLRNTFNADEFALKKKVRQRPTILLGVKTDGSEKFLFKFIRCAWKLRAFKKKNWLEFGFKYHCNKTLRWCRSVLWLGVLIWLIYLQISWQTSCIYLC